MISIIQGFARRVLIQGDATKRINIDLTGYIERYPNGIPDENGLFICAADELEPLRKYRPICLLFVWDSKKNFHPFDLTQTTIPTGTDDFHYLNASGTINI